MLAKIIEGKINIWSLLDKSKDAALPRQKAGGKQIVPSRREAPFPVLNAAERQINR
jgi:hypothetical protein